MLRSYDSTLKLTHEPTGIAVEARWWRKDAAVHIMRQKLRRVLAAKVAAFQRGERINLKDFVVEESDLGSLGIEAEECRDTVAELGQIK